MWIGVFIIFGPIIYYVVDIIVDSISNNIKRAEWKKYYGEEEIINVTTYNNNNMTPNDIMLLFLSQFRLHKHHNYVINYKVFDDKKQQNYAWSVRTTKKTYGWGIIYNIRFHFSNGWVYLSFSNEEFVSGGQQSHEYYICDFDSGTGNIERILDICGEESRIKWKMNGKEPKENLPFNYIPLLSKISSSNGYRSKINEEETSYKNTNPFDLLSFYRNLLGLKLSFSHEELKKSYHEAVKKYHPDQYSASSQRDRANAEMLMKQVNEAYEKLKAVAG